MTLPKINRVIDWFLKHNKPKKVSGIEAYSIGKCSRLTLDSHFNRSKANHKSAANVAKILTSKNLVFIFFVIHRQRTYFCFDKRYLEYLADRLTNQTLKHFEVNIQEHEIYSNKR